MVFYIETLIQSNTHTRTHAYEQATKIWRGKRKEKKTEKEAKRMNGTNQKTNTEIVIERRRKKNQ